MPLLTIKSVLPTRFSFQNHAHAIRPKILSVVRAPCRGLPKTFGLHAPEVDADTMGSGVGRHDEAHSIRQIRQQQANIIQWLVHDANAAPVDHQNLVQCHYSEARVSNQDPARSRIKLRTLGSLIFGVKHPNKPVRVAYKTLKRWNPNPRYNSILGFKRNRDPRLLGEDRT